MRSIQFSIPALVNGAVVLVLFKSRVFTALRLWPPVNARIPNGANETATEAQ